MKKDYIIDKTFCSFLAVSILTSIMQQVRTMTDGIVASQFLGPDALSAINLFMPLDSFMYAVMMLFALGASFLSAQDIAKQDFSAASRQFTVAFISSIAIILTLVGICTLFFDNLISLLADRDIPHIYSLTRDYVSVMLGAFIVQTPMVVLCLFANSDGNPQRVTLSMLVTLVVNAGLDFLFIGSLGMGIRGAACATIISECVGFGILLTYLRSGKCSFGFTRVKNFLSIFRHILSEGLPLTLGMMSSGVTALLLNHIVMEYYGDSGLFVIAVAIQILALCTMINEGINEIYESAGGMYLGEGDYSSFRQLLGRGNTLMVVLVGVVTCAMVFVPTMFLNIFGEYDTQSVEREDRYLSIISLVLIPYFIIYVNTRIHALLGFKRLSIVFNILQAIALIAVPFAAATINKDWFWWAFPIGMAILAAIQMLTTFILSKRSKLRSRLLLLPLLPNEVSTKLCINYDIESVKQALLDVRAFATMVEMGEEKTNRAILCCEELICNILKHCSDRVNGGCFEVLITDFPDRMEVRLKDAGKPFSPTAFNNSKTTDESSPGIGLRLVKAMSEDISHKYMFGLNITTLIFRKKKY